MNRQNPIKGDSPELTNLADHVVHFARLLRGAGLRVGTGSVIAAVAAVERLGIRNPDDLETCLLTFLIQRREHLALFRQAFALYWRNPSMLAAIAGNETLTQEQQDSGVEVARRLADQLREQDVAVEQASEFDFDRSHTATRSERLQQKDFEAMSAEELLQAEKMLSALRLPVESIPSRRFQSGLRGERFDMRASLRAALRADAGIPLRFKRRRTRQAPIVVLCDISGSMSVYSRMFLHFMHAVSNDRNRVYSFVFGTRLTNISRQLRFRDVDEALAQTSRVVKDWSGGTRIEDCLRTFNRDWSRRVLAQGALVILISDGLDRGNGTGLRREMERLSKSSRRLIWLNPLLRYDGFEPRASGIRAILPYVDDFRSAHNVNSLSELADLLTPHVYPAVA